MTRFFFIMTTSVLFLAACASISQKGRMEEFQETAKAYEHALLRSDYRLAASFFDPASLPEEINFDQYKKIKVVDCRPTRMDVSEDKLKVKREVELQYFLVDRNILRSTGYRQKWEYNEEKKAWMMKGDLPVFEN